MGGAQAIAALAYGTETIRRRRRDRRARQPLRAGGQAPGVRARRDRRLRRARATWSWCSATARGPRSLVALDLLAQAEHGEGSLVVAVRRCATARRWSRPGGAGRRRAAAAALVDAEASTPRWRSPRRSRPSTCSSSARDAEALAPRVRAPAACSSARDVGHRVRRLRRGLQPHAARPAARRASPPGSSRGTSAAAWPRCASATPRRRWRAAGRADRPRRGLRACTPRRWRRASGRMRRR